MQVCAMRKVFHSVTTNTNVLRVPVPVNTPSNVLVSFYKSEQLTWTMNEMRMFQKTKRCQREYLKKEVLLQDLKNDKTLTTCDWTNNVQTYFSLGFSRFMDSMRDENPHLYGLLTRQWSYRKAEGQTLS